ncbi:MAG TPA: molybdate ABC transporter permease subunit [Spirochaetota bacterium]|nr:molybdate ABC transporter permease subunit [Spirochaetota bacterium]HPJ33543.1 molybdate ABC transporter permease subunit [Spirochaetota bacterium]
MSLEIFINEYLAHPAIWLTLKVTVLSLLLQLLTGVPLGLYLAGEKNPVKNVVEIITALPMIFPPLALGFFLLLLFGKNGIIGHFLLDLFGFKIIFTFWGVLAAVYMVGLPFMVKSVQAAREQMDNSLVEAAATLGKTRFETMLKVVLPDIRNGIMAGLLLAFGRSIGEVGISLMLGGNIIGRTETLSLAIYNSVFEGEFIRAAVFSIMLSVITVIMLLVLRLVDRRSITKNI